LWRPQVRLIGDLGFSESRKNLSHVNISMLTDDTHSFVVLCFRRQVAEKILRCEYNFNGRRWNGISEQAKEFVRGFLLLEQEDRPSAEEAMRSLWMNRRYNCTLRYPTQQEIYRIHRCMERFVGYSKLKKLVSINPEHNLFNFLFCMFLTSNLNLVKKTLMVLAHKTTFEDVNMLRRLFQKYDVDSDGSLNFHEFQSALSESGYSDEEIKVIFHAVLSMSVCVDHLEYIYKYRELTMLVMHYGRIWMGQVLFDIPSFLLQRSNL
jgi:hypothetical protein